MPATRSTRLDRLEYWDRNAPLPESDDRTVMWNDARAIVLDAYSGFSPKMAELAEPFFDRGWIDAGVKPDLVYQCHARFARLVVQRAHLGRDIRGRDEIGFFRNRQFCQRHALGRKSVDEAKHGIKKAATLRGWLISS